MSLPGILIPGAPCFLAAEYSLAEGDVYGHVATGSGHTRSRRTKTVEQWRVNFSWLLTESAMAEIDDWFERILVVGQEPFSVYLKNLAPGHSWWKAYLAAPYRAEPINGSQSLYWRVTGQFVLDGSAEAGPPDTSTLAVEFTAHLLGTAAVTGETPLAVEFSAHLSPGASLAAEFSAALAIAVRTYELREDGGFELREDGGKERRNP